MSFLAGQLGYSLFQLLQSLLENASRGCNIQSHEALTARTEHFTSIQAERNLQGFIAAYLNHSGYYYIIQEMELNGGYCDLTMIPDLTRFPEVAHAYLMELKYLKTGDTDEAGNKALEEARAQLEQYAQDARLPQLMNGKPIHKIAIIYKGNDLWKVTEC